MTQINYSLTDDCFWLEDEDGNVIRFAGVGAAQNEARDIDVRKAVKAERERILQVIEGHIVFHHTAASDGEQTGADMSSLRGAVAALRKLQRDLRS